MIIKMITEFNLTVVHFARPNPINPMLIDMLICVCAWIYRWTEKLWKIRTGPPGCRCRGPWAAGLLLPKPLKTWFELFLS